jgi:hypothetical protein
MAGGGGVSDLDLTLAAVRRHGYCCILLQPRSKEPIERDGHHHATRDRSAILSHLNNGGNLGIYTGTHVVLDFDKEATSMVMKLGALPPTVETGSGKIHIYVAFAADLQAKLTWNSEKLGEVKRLPTEYTVTPPSVHPATGRPYRWVADPREPLPVLSSDWLSHLAKAETPKVRTPWNGPGADEMLRRAREQPWARERAGKVTFQCPGCREEGRDERGREHAVVFADDGRWTCVVDPAHRSAIGAALGIAPEPITFAGIERLWLGGRL